MLRLHSETLRVGNVPLVCLLFCQNESWARCAHATTSANVWIERREEKKKTKESWKLKNEDAIKPHTNVFSFFHSRFHLFLSFLFFLHERQVRTTNIFSLLIFLYVYTRIHRPTHMYASLLWRYKLHPQDSQRLKSVENKNKKRNMKSIVLIFVVVDVSNVVSSGLHMKRDENNKDEDDI